MPTITSIPPTDALQNFAYNYYVESTGECYLRDSVGEFILSGTSKFIEVTPCDPNAATRTISVISKPPWLSLTSIDPVAGTARLTGVPLATGLFFVSLQCLDSSGYSDSQTYEIEVVDAYAGLAPSEAFEDWLKQNTAPLYLLTIDSSDGTKYLATGKYASQHTDTPANTPFMPWLPEWPFFENVTDDPFQPAKSAWGTLSVINNGLMDEWLDYAFDSREFTWYLGEEDWAFADFTAIGTGITSKKGLLVESGGHFSIPVGDKLAVMDKPFYNARGLSETFYRIQGGPSDGEIIPLAFGKCFNIKPVLYSLSPLSYKFHRGPSYFVHEVRDNGYKLSPSMWHVDLAQSVLYLHFQPAGDITMDVSGYVNPHSGWYFRYPGHLMSLCFATASFGEELEGWAETNARFPYEMGIYIDDDISIREVMERIQKSVGLFVGVRRDGVPYVRPFEFRDTADQVIDAGYIPHAEYEITDRILPVKSVTTKYRPNFCTQSTFLGYVAEVEPEKAETYRQEYSKVVSENTGIVSIHPNAETYEHETLIYSEADAEEVNTRVREMRDSVIDVIRIPLENKARVRLIEPGDTVSIPWLKRYGLGESVLLVTGISGDSLICWRKR